MKFAKKMLKSVLSDGYYRSLSVMRASLHSNKLKYIHAPRVRKYLEDHISDLHPSGIEQLPADALESMDRMILSKLQFLQYGVPSEQVRFLVGHSTAYGFAASIFWMLSRVLLYGYIYNRTVLFDNTASPYEFCFEPISSHTIEDFGKTDRYCKFNFLPQKNRSVHFLRHEDDILKYSNLGEIMVAGYYFAGLVMDSFLVLKEEYRSHIEERRRAMGIDGPLIGVHIRQGDTNTAREVVFRRFTLSDYMETLERVVSETGVKTVFVATDSANVLRQLPRDSGIDFIYDEEEKRYDNANAYMLLKHPELRREETMSAVKNIYLLSSCDYLVGSSSGFFIAAQAIAYFRNKGHNTVRLLGSKEHLSWANMYKSEKMQRNRTSSGGEFYITYIIDGDDRFRK